MNLFDLFRRDGGALQIDNRSEVISRYQHRRMVGRNLNQKLVERLSKVVLHDGAKRLGILQRGELVFGAEGETAVLMDYCIYDVRHKGRNAFEQYLIDSPPDPESDEMACLKAMQQAIYSLFVVESVERGLGVTVRDLLSHKVLLVVDIGFGISAQVGLVFASRLVFHDGFFMTGGAALPVGVLPNDKRDEVTKRLLTGAVPDEKGFFDPAPVIRACLRNGCSSRVQYQEPNQPWTVRLVGQQRLTNSSPSNKTGRNAPCTCGSGKKFKQCCMKRS